MEKAKKNETLRAVSHLIARLPPRRELAFGKSRAKQKTRHNKSYGGQTQKSPHEAGLVLRG